ncbi:MAG: tetratricopeptide repeat protein [Bacteroidales bacterium]
MKSAISLMLIIFIAVSVFSQSKTEQLLAEADQSIKNTNYVEALAKVEEALNHEPSNLKAQQLQIYIYYLKEDFKQSLALVEKAILNAPLESEFYYLRGLINNTRQRYKKAIDDFNKTIDLQGSTELYKVYLNRGIAYMNILEYEKATEDFSTSIALNSCIASAYHSRGYLNYQLRDYSAAVQDFKKALEINDNNAETNFNLGMSYFRLEELDNACKFFQKACKAGNVNACKMVLMECAKYLPE